MLADLGADRHQGRAARHRRRHPPAGARRGPTTPAPTSSARTGPSGRSSSTSPTRPTRRSPGAGPRCRRADRELPERHAGPARASATRTSAATNPGVVYCLHHRLRQPRRCGPARLRLPGAGGRRPDEHHRRRPRTPTKVGVALVDVLTSKDAVIGDPRRAPGARAATGRVSDVEVNLLSSLLGSLANQASAYLDTGTPPAGWATGTRRSRRTRRSRPRTGSIAVCCGNDGQFAKLAQAPRRPGHRRRPPLRHQRRPGRRTARTLVAAPGGRAGRRHRRRLDRAPDRRRRARRQGRPDRRRLRARRAPRARPDGGRRGRDAPPQVRNPITFSGTPITHYARPPPLGRAQRRRPPLADQGERTA